MRLQQTFAVITILALTCRPAFGQSNVSIEGRVIDCTNSRPIAGAVIEIDAAIGSIVTEADGSFVIRDIKSGTHIMIASAPAYRREVDTVLIVSALLANAYNICLEPLLYTSHPQQVIGSHDNNSSNEIIISRDSPQFQSSRSLAEVLDQIPELLVNYSGSKLGEATVSVKGGRSKEILVMLDGVSINSPVTGIADINSVALSSISRIEYYSGSGSSHFGSGAVGGVLSIITGSNIGSSDIEFGGASGQYRTDMWEGSADFHASKGLAISGAYSGYTASNDFMYNDPQFGVVRRNNADIRRQTGSLSGLYNLSSGQSLRFTYHRLDQNNGLPGFVYSLSPLARRNEQRNILTMGLSGVVNPISYEFRYAYKGDNQTYLDTASYFAMNAKYLDTQNQVSFGWNLGVSPYSRLSFSGDYSHERFGMHNLLSVAPYFDDVTEDRASTSILLALNGSHPLEAYLVGADLNIRFRSDYSSLFQPTYSPSVVLGSLVQRWASLRGELSYGKSYRAPLYSSLFWNDGFAAVGNPNLLPERIEESSATLMLNVPMFGDLQLEAKYTHTAYRDLIEWQKSVADRYSPRNLNGALLFTRSIDMSWNLRPLNLQLNYTNLDQISKDRSWERTHQNKQLIFRPRYMQHLSLRYSNNYVDLSYRLRSVSKRYYRSENTKWLDGYSVSDLSVAVMQTIKVLRMRLEYAVGNLSNEEYMLTDRYPLPGRTWSLMARVTVLLKSR